MLHCLACGGACIASARASLNDSDPHKESQRFHTCDWLLPISRLSPESCAGCSRFMGLMPWLHGVVNRPHCCSRPSRMSATLPNCMSLVAWVTSKQAATDVLSADLQSRTALLKHTAMLWLVCTGNCHDWQNICTYVKQQMQAPQAGSTPGM